MPKVAEIIINKPSIELDRPFSYTIPSRLEEKIDIGFRVLVPFGKSNHKIEGYIIDISENSLDVELKEIYELIDPYPLFSNNMILLAKWMKEEYMCTLLDCLKCIAPTGIGVKVDKTIVLNDNISLTNLGKDHSNIVEIIKEHGCEISYKGLINIIGKHKSKYIKELISIGIVTIENKVSSLVKDKRIKIASLNIPKEEAVILMENLSQNSAKRRILNILIKNEYIAAADLVKLSNTTYPTINKLSENGIIQFDELEVFRDPFIRNKFEASKPLKLTQEQNIALNAILDSINNISNSSILIHGVTGSGKTEVYLQAIQHVIQMNGQAIVLVPEISLTPQMVERFKCRFGEKVAVIHSKLSLGERFDQWKKINNGEVDVVVGARSAIFAPLERLKLIIIDEEHENTYKSESKPRYHTKTVAEKRSQLENCVVVLGSATPSIETYYQTQVGLYKLIEMKNRVNECILPKVEIIDMRQELEEGNRSIFSKALYNELSENIRRGEQSILFLNRRGYSTFVSCRQCGHVLKCPNCSITLTYHMYNDNLTCHYCGYNKRNPSLCPSCSSKYIKYFGVGTQKVENVVNKLFPHATVLRMDVDTTGSKYAHQEILDSFRRNNINILIGTQMIAKGLDYPNVTLVGVISADTSLNIDDYRASERTFQLLTQVAGRAGRGKKQGRVVVQTYQPDNYSILLAKKHDYKTFYTDEINIRKSLVYPPFVDIISIIISDNDFNKARTTAFECEKYLNKAFSNNPDGKLEYTVFRPTQAPLSKIKQLYRWRIIAKVNNANLVKHILKDIEKQYYYCSNINIDINSNNML